MVLVLTSASNSRAHALAQLLEKEKQIRFPVSEVSLHILPTAVSSGVSSGEGEGLEERKGCCFC